MSESLGLIPVLDLMGGQVVHAHAGRRDEYKPLKSVLCKTSQPEAVVEGLLALYPFRRIYIADLDAILGRGDHQRVLEVLRRTYPDMEYWVDGGFTDIVAANAWQSAGLGRPVLGSESLTTLPEGCAFPTKGVLSLDFRGEDFLGPTSLMQEAERWPQDVIAMTLARVGLGGGPDLERLEQLRSLNSTCRLYAAGGVRHTDDLFALAGIGASGVLLASALHNGNLSRSALEAHAGNPTSAANGARANSPEPDS
ncbi:MAG: HisA/HisF-related TIM barrel protein [Thiobacillus sp.]